jgi:hypothetical protein
MHSDRLGQGVQSVSENLILITWFLRLSTAGVQLLLVRPAGQVACCCFQSTVKFAAANPWRARACHLTSGRVGPTRSTP